MKTNRLNRTNLIALMALMIGLMSFTFLNIKLSETAGEIKVSGTSTLHDWEMKTSQVKSDIVVNDFSADLPSLESITLQVQVNSLKSESETMDKNAYKTLNASKAPQVSFKSTSIEKTGVKGGNKQILKLKGKLTIAGVTKDKTIEVNMEKVKGNILVLTGVTSLKMTEFGITPPSFMFGSMSTGDEVIINYNLNYKQ